MAAIEGFDLSVNSGDADVSDGMVDGVAVESATLDAAALADGNALIVLQNGSLAIIEEANHAAGEVVLGSATIATGAVTAVSMAGRGQDAPVSADV